MEINDAIRELSRVDYKGWTFRFRALPWSQAVAVDYDFWADNSSPRWRDPRERVIAEGTFTMRVADVRSPVELHKLFLLELLAGPETHEAREFYKVDGEAPFHPHTPSGNYAYGSVGRVAA
jgi:hypothetical protein